MGSYLIHRMNVQARRNHQVTKERLNFEHKRIRKIRHRLHIYFKVADVILR